MTDKEIIEGNGIIAEFMKYTNNFWYQNDRLQYHSSWDMLHKVIDKIKKMQHDPSECFMGTTLDRHLHFRIISDMPISTPINVAWQEVLNFIQWYNIKVNEVSEKANN